VDVLAIIQVLGASSRQRHAASHALLTRTR
jgi:hypothetical protein